MLAQNERITDELLDIRPALHNDSDDNGGADQSVAPPIGESSALEAGSRFPLSLSAVGWITRLAEFIIIVAASTVATIVLNFEVPEASAANYGRLTLLAALLYLIIGESIGLNDVESQLSVRKAWGRVLTSLMGTALILTMLGFLLKVSEEFSRGWVVAWLALSVAGLLLSRSALTVLTRRMKRHGVFNQRAVIYGADVQGSRFASYILGHDKLTLSIVGFYDDRPPTNPDTKGIPMRGGLDQMIADIRTGSIDQVIVALPWSAEKRLREIVERVAVTPVRIRLAPDIASFMFARRPVVLLGDVPVLTLFERPISGVDQAVKWLEDRILGAILLLLAIPVMLVIAVAIKLDSPGPVFFRQRREGFNNRPFAVWKFRSMYVDRCQTDAIVQAKRGDPRVTKVGAVLRRSSLDELPQLFNVLTGSMSLVGPRPHAPSTRAGGRLFSEIVATYAARHNVKPGLTGWAQVCGLRGETTTEDDLQRRLQHDLTYVEKWSLWFDLYILVRTVGTVAFQKSAY